MVSEKMEKEKSIAFFREEED